RQPHGEAISLCRTWANDDHAAESGALRVRARCNQHRYRSYVRALSNGEAMHGIEGVRRGPEMTTIRRAMMPRTSQWGRSVVRAVPHLPGCHGTGPDDNIDRVCLGLDYSE